MALASDPAGRISGWSYFIPVQVSFPLAGALAEELWSEARHYGGKQMKTQENVQGLCAVLGELAAALEVIDGALGEGDVGRARGGLQELAAHLHELIVKILSRPTDTALDIIR